MDAIGKFSAEYADVVSISQFEMLLPVDADLAALAEAAGLPMSCHLFPEISAHLLAITPTCHWLVYVDFANPILGEPLKIEHGYTTPPNASGIGLVWDEDAIRHFLIE